MNIPWCQLDRKVLSIAKSPSNTLILCIFLLRRSGCLPVFFIHKNTLIYRRVYEPDRIIQTINVRYVIYTTTISKLSGNIYDMIGRERINFIFINFRTQFEFDFSHIIIGRAKDDEDHKVCPHIYYGG